MPTVVKVFVPTPLRQYVGNRDAVEVRANTVSEALHELAAAYAQLRRHLFEDSGKIRNFVNVYLNDDDIRYLRKEETTLESGDTI